MKLVEALLRQWQRHSCNHHWIRARWQDGSYGLRCARCMAAYPHTWNEIIGPAAVAPQETPASAPLMDLHRAA